MRMEGDMRDTVTSQKNPKGPRGMHRVRWIKGEEPEIQCKVCFEYLPASAEFWEPQHGIGRCRTCRKVSERPRRAAMQRAKRAATKQRTLEERRTYWREWSRRHVSTLARYERDTDAA